MCGICGFYGFEDKDLLNRMCDIISYRGPDDSGIFLDNKIGLGSRRLSIIDVDGGNQPITNEDESVWIVYNGETFNYKDLKKELEERNHKFYTSSDTEVLVHLYEEHGEEFVKKLRGMFAFALWDSGAKKLIIARDSIGINPLYYTITDGVLLFASEIKSLLEYSGIKKEVDYTALNDYLIFQAPVGHKTLFKGINSLLPGNMIICQNGKIQIRSYWDFNDFSISSFDEEYYIHRLMDTLKETVKMHLVSDVPVGMYLSGGVDSSTILALMKMFYPDKISTFTVGFGYDDTDELSFAREVAGIMGTDHTEIIIQPGDLINNFSKIIWHMEDPIADFGEIANYYLSSAANSKKIKATLSGGGGDEAFGGYWGYRALIRASRIKKILPSFLSSKLLPSASSILPIWFPKSLGIKTYAGYISGEDAYKGNGGIFPVKDERQFFYSGRFYDAVKDNGYGERMAAGYFKNRAIPDSNLISRAQYVDLKIYVDAHMLHADKMNLAHSVEVRYPLLDKELLSFSFTIPENLKIKDSVEKYIFRKTVSEYKLLPKKISGRKKKGFRSPIEHWLSGELKDYARNTITESELINDVMNRDRLDFLFRRSSNPWFAQKIWGLFILALWYEIYFQKKGIRNE
ncbi:MAG: asparagine synthase (glutamine-hydrolyzing) [Candidatus Methanoperedens sp.]|nr:asparagine synthase (glutamine-hydrolyzing) [Candidatus Methanoperedens sp.]